MKQAPIAKADDCNSQFRTLPDGLNGRTTLNNDNGRKRRPQEEWKEETMSSGKVINPKRTFSTDVTSPSSVQVYGPMDDAHETPVVQPNGNGTFKDQDKKKR